MDVNSSRKAEAKAKRVVAVFPGWMVPLSGGQLSSGSIVAAQSCQLILALDLGAPRVTKRSTSGTPGQLLDKDITGKVRKPHCRNIERQRRRRFSAVSQSLQLDVFVVWHGAVATLPTPKTGNAGAKSSCYFVFSQPCLLHQLLDIALSHSPQTTVWIPSRLRKEAWRSFPWHPRLYRAGDNHALRLEPRA